jgi:tetratricopeptide (TPR) repeat protein
MAKKRRVTRKELLKEPDEFITFTGKMIQFARTYQNHLLYGAGALVFIVLIISGVRLYTNWKENKAFTSLEKAMSQYDENRSSKSDATDLSDVKQSFQNVAEKYSRYDGGKLARMMYANICYESGDYDTAIVNYTKALREFSDDPSITLFIQSSLGYAYEAKQDYQTATKYFEQVASSPNTFLQDEALYNLGRLYKKTGDMEKSKKAFDSILSNHPDSIYIEMVKETIMG